MKTDTMILLAVAGVGVLWYLRTQKNIQDAAANGHFAGGVTDVTSPSLGAPPLTTGGGIGGAGSGEPLGVVSDVTVGNPIAEVDASPDAGPGDGDGFRAVSFHPLEFNY